MVGGRSKKHVVRRRHPSTKECGVDAHDQELMLSQKQAITILEKTTNLLPQ